MGRGRANTAPSARGVSFETERTSSRFEPGSADGLDRDISAFSRMVRRRQIIEPARTLRVTLTPSSRPSNPDATGRFRRVPRSMRSRSIGCATKAVWGDRRPDRLKNSRQRRLRGAVVLRQCCKPRGGRPQPMRPIGAVREPQLDLCGIERVDEGGGRNRTARSSNRMDVVLSAPDPFGHRQFRTMPEKQVLWPSRHGPPPPAARPLRLDAIPQASITLRTKAPNGSAHLRTLYL